MPDSPTPSSFWNSTAFGAIIGGLIGIIAPLFTANITARTQLEAANIQAKTQIELATKAARADARQHRMDALKSYKLSCSELASALDVVSEMTTDETGRQLKRQDLVSRRALTFKVAETNALAEFPEITFDEFPSVRMSMESEHTRDISQAREFCQIMSTSLLKALQRDTATARQGE